MDKLEDVDLAAGPKTPPDYTCHKCGKLTPGSAGIILNVGAYNAEYQEFIDTYGTGRISLCLMCTAKAMGFEPPAQAPTND